MDVVRTPDDRIANLPHFLFPPNCIDVETAGVDPVRMHYVDGGVAEAPVVVLLPGQPTWSYLYRHVVRALCDSCFRVIAFDNIGFGRSDKPTDPASGAEFLPRGGGRPADPGGAGGLRRPLPGSDVHRGSAPADGVLRRCPPDPRLGQGVRRPRCPALTVSRTRRWSVRATSFRSSVVTSWPASWSTSSPAAPDCNPN